MSAMYTLHIANKNYSSWSLRPWALLRALDISFAERLHRLGVTGEFRSFSPSGRVPCLEDGKTVVWDSLAIVEYLAEHHAGVWPADPQARAWARCACAEMHSGFAALRNQHGMNVGVRVAVSQRSAAVAADIARIVELWQQGLSCFGGPFLAGKEFCAVDAFFAPVVFRFRSYGVTMNGAAAGYLETMLAHPALLEWETAALAEDFREAEHEAELANAGRVSADFRAAPRS
ncbi:glutathione S-transferase family protein [Sulfuritalea sp.]|uniref:glutathione S-transferase family protein n=1 Tax=Sulfuritalea sp. TaxID=2480090 RepID=UPI00286E442D|nr:glutathione S-transferase family protein [Sulfuritalea sp.]